MQNIKKNIKLYDTCLTESLLFKRYFFFFLATFYCVCLQEQFSETLAPLVYMYTTIYGTWTASVLIKAEFDWFTLLPLSGSPFIAEHQPLRVTIYEQHACTSCGNRRQLFSYSEYSICTIHQSLICGNKLYDRRFNVTRGVPTEWHVFTPSIYCKAL